MTRLLGPDPAVVAANLRRLMIQQCLGINELADLATLGRGAVLDALNGTRQSQMRTLRKLAVALEVDHAELTQLYRDPVPTPGPFPEGSVA
jgi:hypothetical protein